MEYSGYFADDNADIRNCKFAFKCEKRWDDLEITSGNDKNIRFCQDCEQNVYRCRTDHQIKIAIMKNRCIAVRIESKVSREKINFVGVPAETFEQGY